MRPMLGPMEYDKMTTGRVTFSCGCLIVKSNTADDIELAVTNARTSLNSRSEGEIDSVLNAAHMYGNGKREKTDKNERFRKFWIALEALINIDGKDKYISDRIQEALIRLYERNNPEKKYRMKSGFEIIRIKKDRVDQFHKAIENPERVTQLERVLDDLIRAEVGLCHRGYAKEYLEVVV
jgi:hypothetical protein